MPTATVDNSIDAAICNHIRRILREQPEARGWTLERWSKELRRSAPTVRKKLDAAGVRRVSWDAADSQADGRSR